MDEFKTPPIPAWVRDIAHPLYRNIFSFGLGNKNLWGTETLLGDWDGEYLLVAKDFYPATYIADAVSAGDRRAYRHKPTAMTNLNLVKTLRRFGRLSPGQAASSSGFLYISACFLLRNDGKVRGELPDAENVLGLSAPVVRFTLDNMPNLKSVVLMGRHAEAAFRVGGSETVVQERGLTTFKVRHPSYAMSDIDRFSEWKPIIG